MFNNNIEEKLKLIRDFYIDYSAQYVSRSLFIFSLSPENRGSLLTLKISYLVLASISETEFKNSKNINTFKEFSVFSNNLIALLKGIYFEDYVAENDWGEITYFYKDEFYRFCYGSELSITYDFIQAFEIVITELEDAIKKSVSESPLSQFEQYLKLTDFILQLVPYDSNEKIEASPGDIVCSSRNMWDSVQSSIDNISNFIEKMDSDFLRRFSLKLGDFSLNNIVDSLKQ